MLKCTQIETETESTLKLEGSLDAHTVSELRPIFESVVSRKRVIVDLALLTMLDSSGIGLLIALSKRLRTEGREFHVINAAGQPLMVIKLLKVEKLFGLPG